MTTTTTAMNTVSDTDEAVPDIQAIGTWRNNAELLADSARLGYLPEPVLDATYGIGAFWRIYRPVNMVTNDLDGASPAEHHCDFRDLPYSNGYFGSVVFDPPYKLNGTGGSLPLDGRYGVADAYVPPGSRHNLMKDGLVECARVTRGRGFVLVKCQDQISSGRFWRQTQIMVDTAEKARCELIDEFLLQGGRKQPPVRRQVHARRNYSTLLVFRKRT
jgi:hypothetical protein